MSIVPVHLKNLRIIQPGNPLDFYFSSVFSSCFILKIGNVLPTLSEIVCCQLWPSFSCKQALLIAVHSHATLKMPQKSAKFQTCSPIKKDLLSNSSFCRL